MCAVINLDSPEGLVKSWIAEIPNINSHCLSINFLEELIEIPDIGYALQKIDDYCSARKVLGFHFTRAIKKSIEKEGLILRRGGEIREKFRQDFNVTFDSNEWQQIEDAWSSYFTKNQQKSRDQRIFFNFTKNALLNGSAFRLLNHYGGEQVSMCFDDETRIANVLASLGEPMIIKCALSPKFLSTHMSYPWAKIALSSYHCRLNSKASRVDQDGFQSIAVPPEDILGIEVLPGNSIASFK
jgi:hypothetical protein